MLPLIGWRIVTFHEQAEFVMQKCLDGDIEGNMVSHSLTDIFYLLRKDFSVSERKQLVLLLCRYLCILPEPKATIMAAIDNPAWPDLEDGLLMQCAAEQGLDFIITRNEKHFQASPVPAVSPGQFAEMICNV